MESKKSKIITAIGATTLVLGMVALQGCFESNYPAYDPGYGGYGYASGPTYYQPTPVVVGDYDEHHTWRGRDWWVSNRRDWVNDHHKEWLGHDNDRNREAHATTDRDHNRDRN
ncbi:MAG: hypothetical protein ACREQH_13565 [Candidatus Binatus sp.]